MSRDRDDGTSVTTEAREGSARQQRSDEFGRRELVPLLEELVGCARAYGLGGAADGPGASVLLDLEVDGVRCLLLDTDGDGLCTLSPRECEIVRMVASGYTNKTIAAALEISSFTVSAHLRRIFEKLGVRSRAAMVALAVEGGLVAGVTRPIDPSQTGQAALRRGGSALG